MFNPLPRAICSFRSRLPVSLGAWHTVRVSRTGRWAWMYVDDQAEVSGLAPGGFIMLSLARPLYLGGLPENQARHVYLPSDKGFRGCVQKVRWNCKTTNLFL